AAARLEQGAEHRPVAVAGGPHRGGPAVLVLRVHVGAGGQRRLQSLEIPLLDGGDERRVARGGRGGRGGGGRQRQGDEKAGQESHPSSIDPEMPSVKEEGQAFNSFKFTDFLNDLKA